MEVQENIKKDSYYKETTCDYCGKKFITTKQRLREHKNNFCSVKCANNYRIAPPNCSCAVCGKPLHKKPSYIKKTKNITCSYECCYKLKQATMSGENNHQYGLKGELNPSFQTGTSITHYGYRKVLCHEHPFACCDGYVFEHRLIAEKYLLDNINSIKIEGQYYLSKDFVVHHIDFNRLNNNINNLVIMRKEDHKGFHNHFTRMAQKIDKNKKPQEIFTAEELCKELWSYVEQKKYYFRAYTNTSNYIAIDDKSINVNSTVR